MGNMDNEQKEVISTRKQQDRRKNDKRYCE